jgi:hypothetical protein
VTDYSLVLIAFSWLSYTLGYSISVERCQIHLQYATEPELFDQSTGNIIQWQSVQIGIIASEISAAVRQPEQVNGDRLRYLAGQLDRWQSNVPLELRLQTILDGHVSGLSIYALGSIALVHVVYLGAVLLLYHQLLISPDSLILALNISPAELQLLRSDCLMAAERIPQVLSMLQYGGRCWFTV